MSPESVNFNEQYSFVRRDHLATHSFFVRETMCLSLVATSGCFDLLHLGHVRFLTEARRRGDRLHVCLNADESVRRLKGPGRPIFPQAERAEMLLALHCVSYVTLFEEDTPEAVLDLIRPNLWVKGAEYADRSLPERTIVEQHGGQVVFLPELSPYHTGTLLEKLR